MTPAEVLRDHVAELAAAVAGRIRLDNPSYADQKLADLRRNAEMLVSALAEFCTRMDWTPLSDFVDAIAVQRRAEFRVSDVVGGLDTAERSIIGFLEEHDPARTLRSSPQWARLEAGLHRLRAAVVDSLWEAVCGLAVEKLDRAIVRLDSCRTDGEVAAARSEIDRALAELRSARAILGGVGRRQPRPVA